MHRTVYFSFTLIMVSNHVCDTLGDASVKVMPSAILAFKNRLPNSVLPRDLFLCVSGIRPWF